MNKKALVLLSALCLGATVGCSKDDTTSTSTGSNSTNTSSTNTSSSTSTVVSTSDYSIGLGYKAAFTPTQATVNVAVAAFDADGKILNARLDVVQIPLTVTDGVPGINTASNPDLLSKVELGAGYNMGNVSGIKKEVYEQIEAFAAWTKGKTVEEVVDGTPGAGHGVAVNDELATSVTITVDDFEAALADAYETRFEATTGTAANAGVGIYVEMYGQNELTTYIAGAITTEEGTVEAAAIDNVVFPLALDGENVALAESKYVDEDGNLISKKKLGEAYGMTGVSASMGNIEGGAEWDEQAASFESYLVGKTATEVEGITPDANGKVEITGCTIKVDAIVKSAKEAVKYSTLDVITANPFTPAEA